jgi:hypothetical protein
VLELNEDFLILLAYDRRTISKESFHPSPKPQITLGRKIREIKASLLELTMNKVEDVDGVHGVVLMLPSFLFFSFSNLPSNPFSL